MDEDNYWGWANSHDALLEHLLIVLLKPSVGYKSYPSLNICSVYVCCGDWNWAWRLSNRSCTCDAMMWWISPGALVLQALESGAHTHPGSGYYMSPGHLQKLTTSCQAGSVILSRKAMKYFLLFKVAEWRQLPESVCGFDMWWFLWFLGPYEVIGNADTCLKPSITVSGNDDRRTPGKSPLHK